MKCGFYASRPIFTNAFFWVSVQMLFFTPSEFILLVILYEIIALVHIFPLWMSMSIWLSNTNSSSSWVDPNISITFEGSVCTLLF